MSREPVSDDARDPAGVGEGADGRALRLVVGRIGKAHGIRGEVTVEVRTDDPEDRFAPGVVLLTDPADRGPLTVEDAHAHSGRLLVAFEGILDRNGADALRDTLLLVDVDPAERPDDPDEFYDHQLVGLRVVTADGDDVGVVEEMLHPPGQDLISVRTAEAGAGTGVPGGREVLVPFVAEIVPKVDLAAGVVVIAPPPGLLDLAGETRRPGAPDGS